MTAQYTLGDYAFDLEAFFPTRIFDKITQIRVDAPELIERQAKARRKRKKLTRDGKLTILAADEGAEVWVLELGTSEPGEIKRLTSIAEPDDAVITTVGPAHLEGLGDISGVLEEKLALIRGASRAGCAVVGVVIAFFTITVSVRFGLNIYSMC